MRARALVVCPGRGSYERGSLGSLLRRSDAARAVIAVSDELRRARGLPTVRELDAEPTFRGSLHVAGEHASLLTFTASVADAVELSRERYEVVAVAGNSMGWYTALAVSGALSLEDAALLVETMGSYQRGNVIGGQVLYPLTDEEWRPSAELAENVRRTLADLAAPGRYVGWSIHLGGFAVLAGDAEGVQALLATLPPVQRGERTFPVQLPLHSAFHTPLLAETSERARRELAGLRFRAPEVPLVDGRGRIFRPRHADPAEIADYTLGHQVIAPYDFAGSIVTALHHAAPDVVVALGPGNPLGGPLARILVQDGWRGARSRAAFEALSREEPLVLSFGIPAHRERL